MVASYSEIGKNAREVLLGGREGLYQFDQKLALSTKTADGVSLALSAINKGEKADLSLKSSYNYKNYGLTALFKTSTDKIDVTTNIDNLAPGLKATIHATLPDSQSGGRRLQAVGWGRGGPRPQGPARPEAGGVWVGGVESGAPAAQRAGRGPPARGAQSANAGAGGCWNTASAALTRALGPLVCAGAAACPP
ncbi:hypothetical protein MNEG_15601 [Monoraphidium neglectum]|uniref:Uncharacterized protein n=1 Tax=Monoraphidium neglectum TaxID=145388 RepID=A0A0D2LQZ4_9CHLO|nr:hypothetical protein MNEG_15601 [Monoraphidium neglectum]KIY92361.1 hypothetical protein MNEG_15601 [Monoraphidium neglectum]|eukprot:XP_013891381.1 hypothetical protein MNEG_15601 [Monoraphidium neglectum]